VSTVEQQGNEANRTTPAADASRTALVAAWMERDRSQALLPTDRAAIDSSEPTRTLIAELVVLARPHVDLFHACGVLGGLLARDGASPTLVASTIDNLVGALGGSPPAWLAPARAAVAEAFVAARVDQARTTAARRWDPPGCLVPLGGAAVAVVANFPEDDEEAVREWAGRVASSLARKAVRRVVYDGNEVARKALSEALALAGIEAEHGGTASADVKAGLLGWLGRKK
jgi:hypothetical protein